MAAASFRYEYGLVLHFLKNISILIRNGQFNSNTAVQAVGGAAHSWVIGAHRHFHLVQDAFIHHTVFDHGPGRLVHAHVDGA